MIQKIKDKFKIHFLLLVLFSAITSFAQSQDVEKISFDSSSKFTVPTGVTKLKIKAWGAGGAGGSRTTNGGGGGGGAGAYSYNEVNVVPGQELTINVGAGGTGAGGDTSVISSNTTYILAKGGTGVDSNVINGGTGGNSNAGIGSIKTNGENGKNASSTNSNGGDGGASPNGGAGGAGASSQRNGYNGSSPGGGGGGAKRTSSNTRNGGSGGSGKVEIEYSISYSYWGSGSRDLYPVGVAGHRAMLIGSGYSSEEAIPFSNAGAHYVYAKVGETIALASSAQGTSSNPNGGITLFNPAGNKAIDNNRTGGLIANRQEELKGPNFTASSNNGGYIPLYYKVPNGGEGIYRVEFTSRNTSGNGPVISANDNWTQSNDIGIRAWDVSVINSSNTDFLSGRVYTTNLNFTNGNYSGSSSYQNVKFNGKFFVRTNDGFTYKVSHKGTSGIVWAFFVNNKGFVHSSTRNPLYKSLNTLASGARTQVHNPNEPDDNSNITHKMYYTLPAEDMPIAAKVSVNSNNSNINTWLNTPVAVPEVSDVRIVGTEGTEGVFGHKGGIIKFMAPVGGQHLAIEIKHNNGSVLKVIEGTTVIGENSFYWNGVGNNGERLQGTVDVDVNVQLKGAEVHFPFFDIEYNIDGIVIELLDYNNYNNSLSDLVFWNDVDIPNVSNGSNVNPKDNSHIIDGNNGVSSTTNGHKWGAGGSGANTTFGDKKSIDTWTFVVGSKKQINTEVVIKSADLYTNLSYKLNNTLNGTTGKKGDIVEYIIVAGNNGPSDIIVDTNKSIKGAPFSFTLPPGIDAINPLDVTAIFTCNNGIAKESVPLIYDVATRTFRSELQLPDGCTATYKITGKLNGMTGLMIAESTIMRPADISDPDATNGSSNMIPVNPHFECYNNDSNNLPGSSGSISCNNIKEVFFMSLEDCVDQVLYFEDFDRGYWDVNSGRTDWSKKPSISIAADGSVLRNPDGSIIRQGSLGGATASYLFAPGINDSRYSAANTNHSATISVARIKNGYYSVNPPGYVQMGIPTTDSWHQGIWTPGAASYDPNIANSTFDWTPAWDRTDAIRDMSGAVNGSAFLIRGAASAAQSIKPFYEFELSERIQKDKVYTLDIYSYVTYHDKDYMLMDVLSKQTGHIYASVPLKFTGTTLPNGASPTGFSLGWIPLTASFTFKEAECNDILSQDIVIAIRGSQDRSLETGKGFGHTLIDNITFSKRSTNSNCTIHATEITCTDDCFQDIVGKGFGWDNGEEYIPQTFTQPGTDGGFTLDMYELDNSFNMMINGVPLHYEELEFQISGTTGQNVRFKSDGKAWEKTGDNIPDIWKINQGTTFDLQDRFNNPIPAVRVVIDKWGNVKLYGKRSNTSRLEDLEVYNRQTGLVEHLSAIAWNQDMSNSTGNTIEVTQNVVGPTKMYGFGYGQQKKTCETCTIEKEGEFVDTYQTGLAEIGDQILYTFKVKNAGDMEISDVEIIDPLFGFNIAFDAQGNLPQGVILEGDNNDNKILDRNETWTFKVHYTLTAQDIFETKGVYNRAEVQGVGQLKSSQRQIKELSTDPTPYKAGDQGWDPARPNHTYVPLKENGLLITNPMIYQRLKNL